MLESGGGGGVGIEKSRTVLINMFILKGSIRNGKLGRDFQMLLLLLSTLLPFPLTLGTNSVFFVPRMSFRDCTMA